MLDAPLPALDDPEGQRIPDGLPLIVDGHVHLFPDALFDSVRKWFDAYGWPIRYRLTSTEIIEFLTARGIDHMVGLHYAHKPGVARNLNRYMADLCRRYPQLTGMATVYPGEDGAIEILEDGFACGLKGVKLHSHVQCFDMTGQAMESVYSACASHNKALIMHVGREPKSPAYPCDPYEICHAEILEEVIRSYPALRVCVPHLGADEFDTYRKLIEHYDNLWVDTTMTLAEYLPGNYFPDLNQWRADRVIFGTDFPNLPYAWDREIRKMASLNLKEEQLARLLGRNAAQFYGIEPGSRRAI